MKNDKTKKSKDSNKAKVFLASLLTLASRLVKLYPAKHQTNSLIKKIKTHAFNMVKASIVKLATIYLCQQPE